MTDEKDIEVLENFLLGKLSEEDSQIVKRRLIEEPELEALHRDLKILLTAVRHESRNNLARKLQEIDKDMEVAMEKPAGRAHVRWPWVLGLAASLAVIVSVLLYLSAKQPPNEKLFVENFSPYPNVVAPTSRGAENADQAAGFRYYDEKNYAAAAVEFGKVDPKDAVTHFYLANALLANHQPGEAITHFQYCINDGTFRGQATWYLALCFLKLGNNNEAIDLLEGIRSDTATYATAAANILSGLKKH